MAESTATAAQDLQRLAAAVSKIESVKPELPIPREGQLALAIPRGRVSSSCLCRRSKSRQACSRGSS